MKTTLQRSIVHFHLLRVILKVVINFMVNTCRAFVSVTFWIELKINSFFVLERFSFECRKVTSFELTALHDYWLKKLVPLFHRIRSKTRTNRDSHAFSHAFFQPRVVRVLIGSLYYLCPLWLAGVLTYRTREVNSVIHYNGIMIEAKNKFR